MNRYSKAWKRIAPFRGQVRNLTPLQERILNNVERADTLKELGELVGTAGNNIPRVIDEIERKAARQGVAPAQDLDKPAPPGFDVNRHTIMYKDGEPVIEWVRREPADEEKQKFMRDFVAALAEEVKPRRRRKNVLKHASDEIMVGYPLGDHHFGMYAWGVETGSNDYDTNVARDLLADAVDYLVDCSPKSETALFVNLGDFLHMDNRTNRTPTGGHALDTDTRYSKVVHVAAFALAHAIERLLDKHNKVKVVNLPGNHDQDSACWLSIVLEAFYRDEPRVEVDTGPGIFHFHQFGNNMIAMTHGHTCKLVELPGIMAALQPEMWGSTNYRVAWTGHVHHSQTMIGKENRGAFAESFGVLPPNDAFSASHGYVSQREMHSVVFKRSGGVLGRNIYNAVLS